MTMKSSSSPSYDFLLPKTQRINELTIGAVEGFIKDKTQSTSKTVLLFRIMSS